MPGANVRSDHMSIQGGSMLKADGGYLILEAREVLTEPGAWKLLMRTLRTGQLEIAPAEMLLPWSGPLLKPEPIPLKVKVILIGEPGLHFLLDIQWSWRPRKRPTELQNPNLQCRVSNAWVARC